MFAEPNPHLLEGDDEEALVSEYIKWRAARPDRSKTEIARYVFRHQVDPILRSVQACEYWENQIEVEDRIKKLSLEGNLQNLPSKEIRLRQILAIANDNSVNARERLLAHRLVAEMNSEIEKNVNKKVDDKRSIPPMVIAQYDD